MRRILFVDDHDSARGPMAEAMAESLGMDAESVGVMPAREVTLAAEKAMSAIGLHVLAHRPHWVDLHHMHAYFDRVIALGPEVTPLCPDLSIDESWNVPSPQPHSLADNEHVRDVLSRYIRQLAKEQQGLT